MSMTWPMGTSPSTEPQVVAFKATNEMEEIPSKAAQVETDGLNDEQMMLVIRRFKQALNVRMNYINKPKVKCTFFQCGDWSFHC
jgi:hypothetical protein